MQNDKQENEQKAAATRACECKMVCYCGSSCSCEETCFCPTWDKDQ
jgi:hypothetical protein